MPSPSPTGPAAVVSPRRPSSPSSCPPKRKRALSVVEDGVVAVDSSLLAAIGGTTNDDNDLEAEEAGRSACRALLSWHRNGDPGEGPHDVRCDDDGDEDVDGSAVSVLAAHLQGLGFRVGKSVPWSSTSASDSSASSSSVSVYRDSLSSTTTKTKMTAGRQRSSWDLLGGEEFWRVLLGVHVHQSSLERTYRHCVREEYSHLLLLEALRDRLAGSHHKNAGPTDEDDAPKVDGAEGGDLRRRQLETVDNLATQCLDGLQATLLNPNVRVPFLFPPSGAHDAPHGTTDRSDNQRKRSDEYEDVDGYASDDGSTSFVRKLHETIFTGGTTPLWTIDQVRAEHVRIRARNATLSIAYLQAWQRHSARRHRRQLQQHPDLRLTRIEYHASPNPNYERFKLFVCSSSPPTQYGRGQDANLILLPCLARIVNRGVEDTARHLVQHFWDYLERVCHYQSTSHLRARVSPSLGAFFASGLSAPTSPASIALEATFLPRYPFSLYLHGASGTGKSSFVRHLGRALLHVLREHVDPALTRLDTVKQMLNKPSSELELDLELRRNNNDLSLSSLLLSRRQRNRVAGAALSESAAGLVVLALEELAPPATTTAEEVAGESEAGVEPARPTPDPNQHGTLQLLTQRLSGRSGAHSLESHVRSNGVARSGVSGDASIVTVMTSNYSLTGASLAMLRELHLFENMTVVAIKAMEGEDRQAFATSYLHRCVQQQLRRRDRYDEMSRASPLQYYINFGLPEGYINGDVRPLVRMLRMLAYYIAAQVSMFSSAAKTAVHVVYGANNRCVIRLESEQTKVTWEMQRSAASDLLVASKDPGSCCIPQTSQVVDSIRLLAIQNGIPYAELLTLFELWLSGALAPAVFISTRDNLVESILSIVSNVDDVHVLRRIDAGSYRMMRSLYDPIDTPNLRDDIRRLGKDKVVVVELACQDVASQLCIREMIEDTPSMTAYSSLGSALHKEGLLFLVRIVGCEITPEIRSRASLVL